MLVIMFMILFINKKYKINNELDDMGAPLLMICMLMDLLWFPSAMIIMFKFFFV